MGDLLAIAAKMDAALSSLVLQAEHPRYNDADPEAENDVLMFFDRVRRNAEDDVDTKLIRTHYHLITVFKNEKITEPHRELIYVFVMVYVSCEATGIPRDPTQRTELASILQYTDSAHWQEAAKTLLRAKGNSSLHAWVNSHLHRNQCSVS